MLGSEAITYIRHKPRNNTISSSSKACIFLSTNIPQQYGEMPDVGSTHLLIVAFDLNVLPRVMLL